MLPEQVAQVMNQVEQSTSKRFDDLNKHLDFQDVKQITETFDLKEKEI